MLVDRALAEGRKHRLTRGLLAAGLLAGMVVAVAPAGAAPSATSGVDCSATAVRSYERQLNLRAAAALRACDPSGRTESGSSLPTSGDGSTAGVGGTDVNLITGPEVDPKVTQAGDQVWVNGNTVVAAYADSRESPVGYGGLSVSTNGGASFTRLTPSPVNSGHGTNWGDPQLVFNKKLSRWFAGFLASGCGGLGVGLWTSANGTAWAPGACAVVSAGADRPSMWVDNDTASPRYGRMYLAFNDFDTGFSGAVRLTYSDDGVAWSSPTFVHGPSPFRRIVDLKVGAAGVVHLVAQEESGGSVGSPQPLFLFRSVDGGQTFAPPVFMTSFPMPGNGNSGYAPFIVPNWRITGSGALAVTGGTLVYAFPPHGAGPDPGDIAFVRSTNGGLSWSPLRRIDGDPTAAAEWLPSAAASGNNMAISWYDRRHTTNGVSYERWGVFSTDAGLTWSSPRRISDIVIPQPDQPDPNVVPNYAGNYMRSFLTGTTYHDAWTDGRVNVAGRQQMDVFYDRVPVASGSDYQIERDAVPFTPGSTDVGVHCDDCAVPIGLPFPVRAYGTAFNAVTVSSNGNLQFPGSNPAFTNTALPAVGFGTALMPFWDDLRTDAPGDGVFTTVVGSAPRRKFVVEWRAHLFDGGAPVNFEVVFEEASSTFRFVYGPMGDSGSLATIGIQEDATGGYTQSPRSGSLTNGLSEEYLIPTTPSATGGAHILLLHADAGVIPTALRNGILAEPGVASVDVYDVGASTPSLDLLAGYQVVVVISNSGISDPVALGDALADYEQKKQGVVVATLFTFYTGDAWLLGGRWASGGFDPFVPTSTTQFSADSLGASVGGHPLMTGVSSLSAFYRLTVNLASGAKNVAKYTDGRQLLATKLGIGKRAVGANAYLGDSAGGWSGDFGRVVVNAARWLAPLLDTVAPEAVKVTKPASPFQAATSFNVAWSATDPGSGIKNYDVQVRTAPLNGSFGAYANLVTATTAKTTTFNGTAGSTACFKVRARDKAGNLSGYSPEKCTAVPVNDPALTRVGTWTTINGSQYFGGSASKSTVANSTLESATSKAHRIAIIATKCSGCGSIEIFYNGISRGVFSLNKSGSTAYKQVVTVPAFSGVISGTVKVRVVAGPVEIDGVGVNKT